MKLNHLQVYDLTLLTCAPLFIGSGKKADCSSFVYNPETESVSILDLNRFFSLLIDKKLEDRYETFILQGRSRSLYAFLTADCGLTQEEIQAAARYSVSADQVPDAVLYASEIHTFIRDAAGSVYVPGSSVRGAIRTAMLTKMILDEGRPHTLQDTVYEPAYINRLSCLKDRNGSVIRKNALNSIMRGIQISDSTPVNDSCMTLAEKLDYYVDGNSCSYNFCRECIVPETQIHMKITLDDTVLQGKWTADWILEALNCYMEIQARWASAFSGALKALPCCEVRLLPEKGPYLLLGGGTGYVSKTLDYAFYTKEDAMKHTADTLEIKTSKLGHNHAEDLNNAGVSPRMIKYTCYNGVYYPFGLCEVTIS